MVRKADSEQAPPDSVMTQMLAEEMEIRRQSKVRWRWANSILVLLLVFINVYVLPQGSRKIWLSIGALAIYFGIYWAIRHHKDVRESNEKAT
jgi:hypothetical protein